MKINTTRQSLLDALLVVSRGAGDGEAAAARTGRTIKVRCLVTAMRHAARSRDIAELVAANPGQLQLATSSAEVEKAWQAGRIASLIGIEGGGSIGGFCVSRR